MLAVTTLPPVVKAPLRVVVLPIRTEPLAAFRTSVPLLVTVTLASGSSRMLPVRLVRVEVPREFRLPRRRVPSSTRVTVRLPSVLFTNSSTRPKLFPALPTTMLALFVVNEARPKLLTDVPVAWVMVPELPAPPLAASATKEPTVRLPSVRFQVLAREPPPALTVTTPAAEPETVRFETSLMVTAPVLLFSATVLNSLAPPRVTA